MKAAKLISFVCLAWSMVAANKLQARELTLNSIALLATESDTNAVVAHVLGYYAAGDGGGGTFILTNTAAITNFGTRFASTISGLQWERIVPNGEISLRQFGADPVGVKDSRDRLQSLFNISRAKKWTAVIDEGDYRIVSTRPIIIGKIPRIVGRGGKLWNSLPDHYVNGNDYSTNQSYTVASVLDENNKWVSWTSAPMPMPWNGKTEIFHDARDCVIENLKIDGGWATPAEGRPPGIVPITGLHDLDETEEYGYYQVFYNSINVRFHGCEFSNAPGDVIEVGKQILVDNCKFGEAGDHVFYMGSIASDLRFEHNTIITGLRGITSSQGHTDYVGEVRREAIKFRGAKNARIIGNTYSNFNNHAQFIDLQTQVRQPGEVDQVLIADNTFSGGKFIIFAADRSENSPILKVKNVRVQRNIVTCDNLAFETSAGACIDNLLFEDNHVSCRIFAAIQGNPLITNAITHLVFNRNTVNFTYPVAVGFYLSGNIAELAITQNTFNARSPTSPSSNLILSGYIAANWGTAINNQPQAIRQVTIEENTARNFLSLWADVGFDRYDAQKTYTYTRIPEPERSYELFSVVNEKGVLYRNIKSTRGNQPPNPEFWVPYSPLVTDVTVTGNVRYSSEPARSPNNSNKLFSRQPRGNKQILSVRTSGNINVTTTGDPVGYDMGGDVIRPGAVIGKPGRK